MNRTDLAKKVGEMTGLDKKQSDAAVKAVFEAIEEALAAGDKVSIVGFGAFDVKTRPAHSARNPATGESVWVEESRSASFRAGRALKEKLV